MSLKNIAIGLNGALIFLCVGYFLGHGLPQSFILWASSILWLLAPIANLLLIFKNKLK